MSPIQLGALPNTEPMPVGSVQRIIGKAAATPLLAAVLPLQDGAGSYMAIGITPVRNCLWIIKAQTIVANSNSAAGWSRCDLSIDLNVADQAGRSQVRNAFFTHNWIGWQTIALTAMFRLVVGTGYTAYFQCQSADGYTAYHQHPYFLNMTGYTISEGVR